MAHQEGDRPFLDVTPTRLEQADAAEEVSFVAVGRDAEVRPSRTPTPKRSNDQTKSASAEPIADGQNSRAWKHWTPAEDRKLLLQLTHKTSLSEFVVAGRDKRSIHSRLRVLASKSRWTVDQDEKIRTLVRAGKPIDPSLFRSKDRNEVWLRVKYIRLQPATHRRIPQAVRRVVRANRDDPEAAQREVTNLGYEPSMVTIARRSMGIVNKKISRGARSARAQNRKVLTPEVERSLLRMIEDEAGKTPYTTIARRIGVTRGAVAWRAKSKLGIKNVGERLRANGYKRAAISAEALKRRSKTQLRLRIERLEALDQTLQAKTKQRKTCSICGKPRADDPQLFIKGEKSRGVFFCKAASTVCRICSVSAATPLQKFTLQAQIRVHAHGLIDQWIDELARKSGGSKRPCRKCKRVLPDEAFHKHDGKSQTCLSCFLNA